VPLTPSGCGAQRDFWPRRHKDQKFVAGGLYAPYVINRYTGPVAAEGSSRASTTYWLVSTSNPYEVSLMRTTLQTGSN